MFSIIQSDSTPGRSWGRLLIAASMALRFLLKSTSQSAAN